MEIPAPAAELGTAPVELTIPPDARYGRLARLVASGLASGLDFDVDEVEDVRVAVDEAVSSLIQAAPSGPVRARFDLGANELCVEVSAAVTDAVPLDELTSQILRVVTDKFERRQEGPVLRFVLWKARGVRPGGIG